MTWFWARIKKTRLSIDSESIRNIRGSSSRNSFIINCQYILLPPLSYIIKDFQSFQKYFFWSNFATFSVVLRRCTYSLTLQIWKTTKKKKEKKEKKVTIIEKANFIIPNMIGTSAWGRGKGYLVPFLGWMIIAPWTVARHHSLCACHHRVPSSEENIIFCLNLPPGCMGHCVMYSGPSDHGFLGCFTPCL